MGEEIADFQETFVYVTVYVYICIMKQCLNCKKGFEEKKETAKYCSTSCRVMWNRKNKNKAKSLNSEQRLTIIYNKILEVLSDPKFVEQKEQVFNGLLIKCEAEYKAMFEKQEPANFFVKIKNCKDINDCEILFAEINSSGLPFPQKKTFLDLLKKHSQSFDY